jgi:hypothetical protein
VKNFDVARLARGGAAFSFQQEDAMPTPTDIRGVFVEADGDYYGPFATLDDASAFACTRTDASICELDLHLVSSREITHEQAEREHAKHPRIINPSAI